MERAVWTLRAERDLEEIVLYIAESDYRPHVAHQIAREIRDRCDFYATQPNLGESRPDLGERLHIFRYKRWAIIYRVESEEITVVRVVDGSRDYPKLFDE